MLAAVMEAWEIIIRESELYLVRVEVKWTDSKPQVLDLQTYIRTKD